MPSTREVPRRPLVLGYHAVSSTWRSQLAISEILLEEHLEYLRARGYAGLTFTEAEQRRLSGTLPDRSVVVTFDDGYASTMRAMPVLERLGFPGTVFVVGAFVESCEPLSWPGIHEWHRAGTVDELRPLSWADLERLTEAGWEIGSHTMTHPLLTRVSDSHLRAELVESRELIERRLGGCSTLAFPYGVADARVAGEAARAGYLAACTLTFVHHADEPHRRPRVGIGPKDRGLRFRAQVSSVGQAARRSPPARLSRKIPRRRTWLPDE